LARVRAGLREAGEKARDLTRLAQRGRVLGAQAAQGGHVEPGGERGADRARGQRLGAAGEAGRAMAAGGIAVSPKWATRALVWQSVRSQRASTCECARSRSIAARELGGELGDEGALVLLGAEALVAVAQIRGGDLGEAALLEHVEGAHQAGPVLPERLQMSPDPG